MNDEKVLACLIIYSFLVALKSKMMTIKFQSYYLSKPGCYKAWLTFVLEWEPRYWQLRCWKQPP